jgi:GH24 family phage-related lysozyme (muramidase)
MAKNNTLIFVAAAVVVGIVLLSGNASGAGPGTNAVSQDQISQTEGFEGFRATAYLDGTSASGTQLYSIGYGHQIQPGESSLLTGSITTDQAEQMLMSDMQSVVNYINNSGVQLTTQGQMDALSDFGYNEGLTALGKVIANYNSNGAGAVPAQLMQYVYWHPVPGGAAQINQNLVTRRNANVAAWNS